MAIQFSVVVPVYNTPQDKFRRCIESIVHQTYTDYEVIIVDDGSEKEYARYVDSIAELDARIKVIHKKNEGSAIARNTGIENALGEYITFVDSDDIISPYCFAQSKDAIDQTGADLVIGLVEKFSENDVRALSAIPSNQVSIKVIDGEKQLSALINHMLGYDEDSLFLYENGYFGDGPVARFCRAGVVKSAMFSPESMCSDDTVWNLKMVKKCSRVAIVDDFWYAYLIFYGSKTQRFRQNSEAEVTYRIRQYYELIQELWSECKNGLYVKVWTETFTYINTFLFHKENHLSFFQKYKSFKRFTRAEDYRNMLKHITFSVKESKKKVLRKKMVAFFTLHGPLLAAYLAWMYHAARSRKAWI